MNERNGNNVNGYVHTTGWDYEITTRGKFRGVD